MDHITMDTGLVTFGVNETMKALEELAVDKLILWEDLDYQIATVQPVDPKHGKDQTVKYLRFKDVQYKQTWMDKKEKIEYKILDFEPLIDELGEKF